MVAGCRTSKVVEEPPLKNVMQGLVAAAATAGAAVVPEVAAVTSGVVVGSWKNIGMVNGVQVPLVMVEDMMLEVEEGEDMMLGVEEGEDDLNMMLGVKEGVVNIF